MAARRAHNPEVAGSSPVPATKRLFRAVKDGSFYFTKALLNPLFSQIGKFCNLNKYFYWNILQYVLKILRQNFLPSLLDQSTKTSYEFIKGINITFWNQTFHRYRFTSVKKFAVVLIYFCSESYGKFLFILY